MTRAAKERRSSPLSERIESVGDELRGVLGTVIRALAGDNPRPAALIRAADIDKSLAGRLLRAARADSSLEFMHLVPSPSGLRILLDHARRTVDAKTLADFNRSIERFRQLVDAAPGGRDAIDAHIAESSPQVREKAEQTAKRGAFKSMSVLLGHFCEILASSLFLVRSPNGHKVDAIETITRIGVQRLRPSTPLALFGILRSPDELVSDAARIESLSGGLDHFDFLLPEFSDTPLPALDIVDDGPIRTFVLAPDPSGSVPKQVTSAIRIRNIADADAAPGLLNLRGYSLSMPARTLVRDLYIEEGIYPSAIPSVSFVRPTPGGFVNNHPCGECPAHSALDFTAPIEQLPANPRRHRIAGIANHVDIVQQALAGAGLAGRNFRGWRCTVSYPVPFIEMVWSIHVSGLGAADNPPERARR